MESDGRGLVRLSRFPTSGETSGPRIEAQASGYLPAEDTVDPNSREIPVLALDPALFLTGIVVDGAEGPVAGAEVRVIPRLELDRLGGGWSGGHGPEGFARSGNDGRFRIAPLGRDASYVVRASAPGRSPAEVQVPRAEEGSRRLGDVRLVLGPSAVVRGRAVSPDGAPVAGARVVLAPHTEDMTVERRPPTISAVTGDEGVANAFVHVIQQRSWNRLEENQAAKELREPLSTDEDGAFEVGGLAADVPVFVAVAAQGYRQSTLADVEVPRDEPLIIHLEAQVAVDGVVVDSSGRPVEGVRVSAGWRSGSTTSSTSGPITDAEGRFHLESVALGSVTFEASGNGYVTRDPVVVEVVAGETPDPVRIEVVRGGRVSGRVVDATGGPVAGSKASAQWELEGRMASQAIRIDVAADGTFVAEGLPDRRVELIGREDPTSFALDRTDDGGRFEVSSLGPGPAMVLVLDDTGQAIALRGVEIPASDPLVLDLELHAITGRLVIPGTTNAPASTRVTLVPEALGGRLARLGLRTVRSGSDGTFAFDGVSDGPWNLSVDDGTHAPVAIRVVVSGSDVALAAIPLGPLDETAGDDNAPEEGSPPPGRQD